MISRIRPKIAAVFALAVLASLGGVRPDDAARHLQKARKDIARDKWENAEKHLNAVLAKWPQQPWADEALFWQAYILEAQDRIVEAYQKFAELLRRFPRSPWRDNAVAHQMHLAQVLYLQGKAQFKEKLKQELQSTDSRIRHEAALCLAELGDSTAVSILEKLQTADDPWLEERRKLAVELARSGPIPAVPDSASAKNAMLTFRIRARKAAPPKRKKSWREEFMLFKTRRYKLYEGLYERYYADDKEWSLPELVDYGLFHIVPQDEFEQYFALRDPYDRHEWLRKFWKKMDPTPTTPENEMRDEFMRRVIKARAEYGKEWNYRHFLYLRNQYLRTGWSWAPWDSRGELLIKMGEPDFEDFADFNVDIWYYSKHHASFGINRYVTNIYGQGYFPAGGYIFQHVGGPAAIEVDFIYNQQFFFDPLEGVRRIGGIRLAVQRISNQRISVSYSFPRKKLAEMKNENAVGYRWLRRLVIFNPDYIEVYRDEKKFQRRFENPQAAHKVKRFRESIEVPLEPGRYILALRIQDLQDRRLGIVKQEFE